MHGPEDAGLPPPEPLLEGAAAADTSLAKLEPWKYLDSEFRRQLLIRLETRAVMEKGGKAVELYCGVAVAAGLIAQAATCVWGCRGGEHLEERVLRRVVNYAVGCVSLSVGGLYDEAIGLLRNLAEVANLVQLFTLNPAAFSEWNSIADHERWKWFKPNRVRERIDEEGQPPIVDREMYAVLCGMGVHVTPWSTKTSHHSDRRLYVGAEFSDGALEMILNELAVVLGSLLPLVGVLLGAPASKRTQLDGVAGHLRTLTVDSLSVTQYIERLRGSG